MRGINHLNVWSDVSVINTCWLTKITLTWTWFSVQEKHLKMKVMTCVVVAYVLKGSFWAHFNVFAHAMLPL